MQTPLTLREAYSRVANLIPDYEWTTLFDRATNDLIHIPTHTVLSCDVEGYYLTVNNGTAELWDYEMDEYVLTTFNPLTAAIAFVMHVIKETILMRLENN